MLSGKGAATSRSITATVRCSLRAISPRLAALLRFRNTCSTVEALEGGEILRIDPDGTFHQLSVEEVLNVMDRLTATRSATPDRGEVNRS